LATQFKKVSLLCESFYSHETRKQQWVFY